jgi:hypothetical protein
MSTRENQVIPSHITKDNCLEYQAGDTISIRGAPEYKDGEYTINRVDKDDHTLPFEVSMYDNPDGSDFEWPSLCYCFPSIPIEMSEKTRSELREITGMFRKKGKLEDEEPYTLISYYITELLGEAYGDR